MTKYTLNKPIKCPKCGNPTRIIHEVEIKYNTELRCDKCYTKHLNKVDKKEVKKKSRLEEMMLETKKVIENGK